MSGGRPSDPGLGQSALESTVRLHTLYEPRDIGERGRVTLRDCDGNVFNTPPTSKHLATVELIRHLEQDGFIGSKCVELS